MMLTIRAFAFTIYTVPDTSLQPALRQGDRVVVNRLERVVPQRGDIVVCTQRGHDFIGRVTALPGDTIAIDTLRYRIPLGCLSATCRCTDCRHYLVSRSGQPVLVGQGDIVGRPHRLFSSPQ